MAMEVAAMTAGPVKNLTAIENVATDFPQAMIFGCKAMNKPIKNKNIRDDVRVDPERGDRGGGPSRELVGDEGAGPAILEHEEHEGVPDDALHDDDLDHEVGREVAVHGSEQRDPHDEGVGEGREGEEGDGPVEGPVFREGVPEEESREDDDFLEGIGGYEVVVHGVDVVGGDEVEAEEWDGEDGHETVDAGALVGGKDLPPTNRAVREDHGHVEWGYGRQNVVFSLVYF
ncbi:S-adenosyl-L-methionine-dependentmethyltransferases superfamily protein [Striga asiatica]|uniref:S-adenosyl-L-methionine-dependentmethyltransferases superfamily protein n=1 Tax=Striga asiatica TaxID=4170 RepID=A0A5A7R5M5_STRAF|nr:S-adenosyl-L-methionine-dependentmethyltransferases superfamily protein [Striga asiatica]